MLDALHRLWPGMVVGTVAASVSLWLGWWLGRFSFLPPVRVIGWWVEHVVVRLVCCDRWWRRAAAIFLNNASICAAVVGLGGWAVSAWIAVGCVGLTLGMGLREMGRRSYGFFRSDVASISRSVRFGFALNMLEPPAIVLSLGLCLGRSAVPADMDGPQMWRLFLLGVLPALAVAAMGESLWLGAYRRTD